MKNPLSLLMILVLLILSSPVLAQDQNGDVNCDDNLDLLDIIYMIEHKFKEGPEPCAIDYPETPTIVRYEANHVGPISNNGGEWSNVVQITVDIPSSGQVYLTANCVALAGDFRAMGFGTTPTDGLITFPSDPNPFEISNHIYLLGNSLDDVVSVDAGSHTFFYNLYSRDYVGQWNFYQVSLTAIFFPNNDSP